MPVFVLTHHEREPLAMTDGTTFHFVTAGIEAALAQARDAAAGKDVVIGGGAAVAQQCLGAGLVDEMEVHVVPLLLAGGPRLFEGPSGWQHRYECTRVVASPAVAHYRYRRVG